MRFGIRTSDGLINPMKKATKKASDRKAIIVSIAILFASST
ncbi:hypothetical protein ECP02999177_1056 [Escherichia coli P0299917.7]|nr:hypothetical protein ECP02999177_1056 [Escherichia coli P0299917.7]